MSEMCCDALVCLYRKGGGAQKCTMISGSEDMVTMWYNARGDPAASVKSAERNGKITDYILVEKPQFETERARFDTCRHSTLAECRTQIAREFAKSRCKNSVFCTGGMVAPKWRFSVSVTARPWDGG